MCLGVPGQIVSTVGSDPLTRLARVRFGGVVKDVNLAYAPSARVGDYVIVHVGFAIAILDEAEAQRILETLHELGELVEKEAQ